MTDDKILLPEFIVYAGPNGSGNDVLNDGLNESEPELLTIIAVAPSVTQDWYSEKTGFSIAKVQRIMKKLQEKGIIYRYGSKKRGKWIVKGVTDKNQLF